MLQGERVLVLNASYEPVNICGVRRAVGMVFKGVARVEETDPMKVLRSPSTSVPIPIVVRLLHYIRTPYRSFTFSKKSILLRDRHTCQYCGVTSGAKDLTLDHVVPRSRGGASDWENLVASCKECNLKKSDSTPQEAGMRLLRRPRASRSQSYLHYLHVKGRSEERWKKYLFYEYTAHEGLWDESDGDSQAAPSAA